MTSSRAAVSVAGLMTAVTALSCGVISPGLCFDDSAGPRAVNIPVLTDASPRMTAALCATACGLSGYVLAGLTGHTTPVPAVGNCYCGSEQNASAVKAPPSDCSMLCPGGGSPSCGANNRMALYNITCDSPMPAPPGPSLNGSVCTQPETRDLPFCDVSLTFEERTRDLVSRITMGEAGRQLTARNAPAIPRLGIPAYYWGTNFVHGITNPVTGGVLCLDKVTGPCVTIWPSGPGLGASFNSTAWHTLGDTSGIEMRALNNVNWGPRARADGMDGLDSWGPTINLIRDPRVSWLWRCC